MNRRILALPMWLRVVLGVVLIVWGGLVIGRPFDAVELLIATLGIAAIAAGLGSVFAVRNRGVAIPIIALFAILLGLGCLWFQQQAIRVLPFVIAGLLLAMGARRLWAVITRRTEHRFYTLVSGIAWAGLGATALLWPDVTLIVLGFTVGPLAIGIGAAWLVSIVRAKKGDRRWIDTDNQMSRPGRLRTAGAIIGALLVLASLAGTAVIQAQTPSVNAFYDAPASLPTAPGQLVRQNEFTSELPENSRAWKILYTTPALDGSEGVGSGMVYVPTNAGDGPFPVILWVHGTIGVARECAPSLRDDPLSSGAALAFEQVLARGWAIVMPDYIGMGTEAPHPYLVGRPTAQSSLDALRAAYQLEGAGLGNQAVVWGHSQGGGAALWVGIESQSYAPELDLIGVVALSPATDLTILADHLSESSLGRFFSSYILEGFSGYYDDIEMDDYIRPGALPVYQAIAGRCIESTATIVSFIQAGIDDDIFSQEIDSGPLRDRLNENVPGTVTGIPTFIGQGLTDGLILPEVQRAFTERFCGEGQVVEYTGYAGRDHLSVVEDDSPLVPDVIAWTEARFAGTPPATSCTFTER